MKKVIFSMAIFAMAAKAFTGCSEKEENPYYGQTTNFTLSVADMNGQKAHMEDNYACWDNGDAVNINGETYAVTVVNNDANLISVPMADNYYAIFPADAATGDVDATTTVTFPRTYTYTATGGVQKIEAPMAAKANGTNLSFRCLTTLWNVEVPTGYTVDSIVVTANKEALSGNGSVNVEEGTVTNLTGSKSVSLICNGAAAGTFYVPVPAISNETKLSVTAYVKESGVPKFINWAKTANGNISNHFVMSLSLSGIDALPYYEYIQNSNNHEYFHTGLREYYNTDAFIRAKMMRLSNSGTGLSQYMFANAYTQYELGKAPLNLATDVTVSYNGSTHAESINGGTNTSWAPYPELDGTSIVLFAMGKDVARQDGPIKHYCHARLYYCQIEIAHVLERNYIPCYADGQFGMYDLMNNTFYTNEGTGFFSGPAAEEM